MSGHGHITRREFIGAVGAAGALAAAPRLAGAQPAAVGDVIVDVHCHAFNAPDLPLTGFVAHYAASGAITDFSREVSAFPETVLRKALDWARRQLRKPTPTAQEELTTTLPALFAGDQKAQGVSPLASADIQQAIGAVFGEIGSIVSSAGAGSSLDSAAKTIERYVDTLFLVLHDHATVAATMARTYSEVSLFTPLLVDYDAWSADHPDTPLATQVVVHELVSKLSMAGKIDRDNARLHPFVAFDPGREVNEAMIASPDHAYRPFDDAQVFKEGDAYACDRPLPDGPETAPPSWTAARPQFQGRGALRLVRHAIERAGFLGVKVYPPVGFAPLENARFNPNPAYGAQLDLALHAFYAYCEAEQVPITAHTSPGNVYALGYGDLVSPDRWAVALKRYPKLRFNMGHFGHDAGLNTSRGIRACEAWMRQAAALMDAYDGVYADMSFSPLVGDADYAKRYLPVLADLFQRHPKLRRRVMYGSDWWLNKIEDHSDTFMTGFRQRFRDAGFDAETITNVMGRNALRFLGFIDEANVPTASRSQARLARYYKDAQKAPPSWLLPVAG
jgi:predicted TIM-barrel fold metal-dependent hydrolase